MKADSSGSASSVKYETRPALGQVGALGRLYNANLDTLLSNTLLKTDELPSGSVETHELSGWDYKIILKSPRMSAPVSSAAPTPPDGAPSTSRPADTSFESCKRQGSGLFGHATSF